MQDRLSSFRQQVCGGPENAARPAKCRRSLPKKSRVDSDEEPVDITLAGNSKHGKYSKERLPRGQSLMRLKKKDSEGRVTCCSDSDAPRDVAFQASPRSMGKHRMQQKPLDSTKAEIVDIDSRLRELQRFLRAARQGLQTVKL